MCLKLFGEVPLLGFFWVNVVFPLVICLFLVLVCREWRWTSWTRIYVFHHVLAFSSLISFLVLFLACVFPLWGLPRVLLVLLSYCLSIQPFRYAFSVAIFSSKIVRFLWRLVVGMFLCHALTITQVFHAGFNWCFFTEGWLSAILLWSLGIF